MVIVVLVIIRLSLKISLIYNDHKRLFCRQLCYFIFKKHILFIGSTVKLKISDLHQVGIHSKEM